MPEKYLKTSEAAEYLGISPRWLEVARSRGDGSGPGYVKLERAVRYKLSTLDSFMASREHAPDTPTRKAGAAR
jgi:hypothetical protein